MKQKRRTDRGEPEFREALAKLLKPEAIEPWLRTPNPAFDGAAPLELLARGKMDQLWRMVYELESGEPG